MTTEQYITPTDSVFWPYILPILEEQKTKNEIKYIQMSDANGMDRFWGDSLSSEVYPGIFVLRPPYAGSLVDNALMLARFSVTIFIFFQGDGSDYEAEDLCYRKSEKTAADIIQQIQHDKFAGKNHIDFDSIRVEPIQYTNADATYGYELNFKLGLPANHIFC